MKIKKTMECHHDITNQLIEDAVLLHSLQSDDQKLQVMNESLKNSCQSLNTMGQSLKASAKNLQSALQCLQAVLENLNVTEATELTRNTK